MRFTVSVAMCEAEQVLDVARAAEDLGWDGVAVPESVFYPETTTAKYPYTPDGSRFWAAQTPFVDPWVAIPAMAAVTSRLRFFTNVMKVSLREPLLVAKTVGTAAAISANRVALGVGISWMPEEFAWLHQEMASRGRRLDEAIEVVRLALTGEYVEYHGQHYDFGRLMMRPAPTQPVPILVGGHSEPALRRAARLGDGWVSAVVTAAETQAMAARLEELRAEYGRAELPFEVVATPAAPPTPEAYAEFGDVGATEVVTVPWYLYGEDPAPLANKVAALERFTKDVIAALS